jgi:hypothetical protein
MGRLEPTERTFVDDGEDVLPEQTPSLVADKRSRNFFVRFWRGDYGLPFSYWVVGMLVGAGMVAVTTVLSASGAVRETGGRAAGFYILGVYLFAVVVTLWQLVGIWRSADNHPKRGGSRGWAGAAKLAVALGVVRFVFQIATQGVPVLAEAGRLIAGVDHIPPYQLRVLNGGTELELAGGMPFGTTDAVKAALDGAPRVRVIHLNSSGGRINEAYKLSRLIRDRNLATYTATQCASACAIAFISGKRRYLAETARLGFHGARVGTLRTSEVKGMDDDLRETMRSYGVSNAFIDRALGTSPDDIWYPTTQELIDAHVVDTVVDSRAFGLSGVAQHEDANAVEAKLLELPLYAALAKYDKKHYAAMRDVLVKGVQAGRPQLEITRDVRAIFVQQVIPAYLKTAPDEALLNYWAVQLSEVRFLKRANIEACANLSYPQYADRPVDTQRLLPPELLKADLAALTTLIQAVGESKKPAGTLPTTAGDSRALFLRIKAEDPLAFKAIAYPEMHRDRPEDLCRAGEALYSAVLDIPDRRRAGALMRHLASGGA